MGEYNIICGLVVPSRGHLFSCGGLAEAQWKSCTILPISACALHLPLALDSQSIAEYARFVYHFQPDNLESGGIDPPYFNLQVLSTSSPLPYHLLAPCRPGTNL